jgi:hypothetical protein
LSSSQKAARDDEQRLPLQQSSGSTSNHTEVNVQKTSSGHYGNGSTKSKFFDSQDHKNLSPSIGLNNSKRNGPTTPQQQQQYQHLHHPHQALAVFGNKTKNNVGHKASQTKRIQLSTAAKRCKSINRSSAVDNNNSKSINLDDICKADDGPNENDDNDEVDDTEVDCEAQHLHVDTEAANNSISTQSTESPTLVKVKAWYTESSVPLPSSQGVIF